MKRYIPPVVVALLLAACTAAAPVAVVANTPAPNACGDHPSFARIQSEAEHYDWQLVQLNGAQLRQALAVYNATPPDHLSTAEVDSAYVGFHDGQAPRFVFFKGGCNVGAMLVVGPDKLSQIMGHDA